VTHSFVCQGTENHQTKRALPLSSRENTHSGASQQNNLLSDLAVSPDKADHMLLFVCPSGRASGVDGRQLRIVPGLDEPLLSAAACVDEHLEQIVDCHQLRDTGLNIDSNNSLTLMNDVSEEEKAPQDDLHNVPNQFWLGDCQDAASFWDAFLQDVMPAVYSFAQ